MVYTDIGSLVNGIAAKYGAQGTLGAKSMAEAKKLVQQWARRVQTEMRKEMPRALYMPGTPKVYSRTGRIFNSIAITYSNGIAEAKADIHYTDYPSVSFVSGAYNGAYDVMRQLLEQGYSVHANVWFRDYPYCGQRPGGHLMEYVARILRAEAAAQGVTITYS